jgi:hypothetical protein
VPGDGADRAGCAAGVAGGVMAGEIRELEWSAELIREELIEIDHHAGERLRAQLATTMN